MAESVQKTIAYLCECGKKWTFTEKEANSNSTLRCRCGRTIVVRRGIVFGEERQHRPTELRAGQ